VRMYMLRKALGFEERGDGPECDDRPGRHRR
jgi:hypothetical protein